jgi:hypothetical protein
MLEEVRKKCEGRICKLEESTVKRRNTICFTNHPKNIMLEQNTFMHTNSAVRTWANTKLCWKLICSLVDRKMADRYTPFGGRWCCLLQSTLILCHTGSTFLPSLHGVTFTQENKLHTTNTDVLKLVCFSIRTFLSSVTKIVSLTFWHLNFIFNSNKSPTWCNSFSVYYPDFCLQLNMFRAFSRPSSGAQWLQWQPLVLPSYRGDSRAMLWLGRHKAQLSPRYEGKTSGCHCSHWAPDDGRENARNMLSCKQTSG